MKLIAVEAKHLRGWANINIVISVPYLSVSVY